MSTVKFDYPTYKLFEVSQILLFQLRCDHSFALVGFAKEGKEVEGRGKGGEETTPILTTQNCVTRVGSR